MKIQKSWPAASLKCNIENIFTVNMFQIWCCKAYSIQNMFIMDLFHVKYYIYCMLFDILIEILEVLENLNWNIPNVYKFVFNEWVFQLIYCI